MGGFLSRILIVILAMIFGVSIDSKSVPLKKFFFRLAKAPWFVAFIMVCLITSVFSNVNSGFLMRNLT